MPRNDQSLPNDPNAERGVIGCLLHGLDDESIDPADFYDRCRQVLIRGIVYLRGEGLLAAPSAGELSELNRAARANAERLAASVTQAGTWKGADDPRVELGYCLELATQPGMLPHYAERVRAAARRRRVIQAGLQLSSAARQEDVDLAALVGSIDLLSLIESGGSAADGAKPVLVRMSDVRPEPVRWLWPGRIARGKLTIIAGDPGLGKSFLTIDLAARASQGWKWPDGAAIDTAGGVILLNAEDDAADTIRPRLDACGADVGRIAILQAVRVRDRESGIAREESFCFARDLAALESAITSMPNCRLVVVDPITAYLGGTDSHKNAEIRGVLAPLAALAQRLDVAIVAVSHLNKASGMSALYRTMGSLAFVAAARAVWLLVKDHDDPTGKRRLLLPAKNNLGNDTSGLAFCLKPNDLGGGQPVLAWEADPVTQTADEALAPWDGRKSKSSPVLDDAKEWLTDQLQDGPKPQKKLQAAAKADGLMWNAVLRAKKELRIKPKRKGFGPEGSWSWSLPAEDGPAEDNAA